MKNHKASELFEEYKGKTIISCELYNKKVEMNPENSYGAIAAGIWRYGILAEIWGTIATKLSGGKINFMENWRLGK